LQRRSRLDHYSNSIFTSLPAFHRYNCALEQAAEEKENLREAKMRHHFRLVALVAVVLNFLFGGIASGQSPSFDCNKARHPDEVAICQTPQLAELDNLVAAGYDFLKSTRGRPFADQIGIPFWRSRQACESDIDCIRRSQIEAINGYRSAGAPLVLPQWAIAQEAASHTASAPSAGAGAPTDQHSDANDIAQSDSDKPPISLHYENIRGAGEYLCITPHIDKITINDIVINRNKCVVVWNGLDGETWSSDRRLPSTGTFADKMCFEISPLDDEGKPSILAWETCDIIEVIVATDAGTWKFEQQ
jgi:uncharacterized protein